MSRRVRAYLVRHGEAASGWGDDLDPGLSDRGRRQAEEAAAGLAALGPLPVVTSPLRRCRETAAAFEHSWGVQARVDEAVGEIASPGMGLEERAAWLRGVMRGTWDDVAGHEAWRAGVVEALRALRRDTVVATHFVAINVVVGEATGRREVVCCTPANCSVTVVDVTPGSLDVVALGAAADTVVR